MKRVLLPILLVAFCSTCGCFNSPTPTVQITGTYVSPVEYEDKSEKQLAAILNALSQREDQLIKAQDQRIKSSRMQAFWVGYGTGDGVEASELANVRGRKQAVMQALAEKQAQDEGTILAARK